MVLLDEVIFDIGTIQVEVSVIQANLSMILIIPDITKTGSNKKRIDSLINIVLKKITTKMGGRGDQNVGD